MTKPRIKNQRILLERIEKFISPLYFADVNLHGKLYNDTVALASVYHYAALERISYNDATINSGNYEEVTVGMSFGPTWSTHWFKIDIDLSRNKNWVNKEVRLRWNSNSEAMVWMNGSPLQGLTGCDGQERYDFILVKNCQGNEIFTLYIEMAANGMFGAGKEGMINAPNPLTKFTLKMVELAVLDHDVYGIIRDLKLIIGIVKNLPEDDDIGQHALHVGCDVVNCFQPENKTSVQRANHLLNTFFKNSETLSDEKSRYIIHAMGHCHIDTAWLWPYAETIRKCGRSWSSVVGLMKRFPDFTFACSQAAQFQWVKEKYPTLYADILEYAKQKKFLPTGGTWVEMDGNIPSGESFVRQFLYGQKFFKNEFGSHCDVFWLPDTFGYSAQLPQICKLAGIKYFLTQKISWSLVNKFPHNTFMWKGIDNSSVLTHFPPGDTYESSVTIKDILKTRTQNKEKGVICDGILLYGFGDGGGGPTEDMLENIERLKNVPGFPRLKHSSPADFYEQISKNQHLLHTWAGELYLELHQGTFTSQALIKKRNRKCEFMLKDTELLHVLATIKVLGTEPNENKKSTNVALESVWRKLLLNQFHDVLPGTCIKLVVDDAEELYKEIVSECEQIDKEHKSIIFNEVDDGETVLLNTTSFARREVVETGSDKHLVDVPAMGYILLKEALSNDVAYQPPSVVKNSTNDGTFTMKNEHITVSINSSGQIYSCVHLESKRECILDNKMANCFILFTDIPLYWDAWDVMPYNDETRQNISQCTGMEIIENGPLTASLKFSMKISERSEITQIISLEADSEILRFDTQVEWHENRKMLKVEFPFNVHTNEATYEIQSGHLKRPTHVNTSWDWAKYEVCGHKWMDISEYGFGVALLNDCKYGFSTYESTVQMSLLRSPKAPDEQADMGVHTFSYAIVPHTGTFQSANIIGKAENFNNQLHIFQNVSQENISESGNSLFSVDNRSVVIQCVKMHEEKENVVVIRMYESFGGRATATLKTFTPFRDVYRTNILEEREDDGYNEIVNVNEFQVSFTMRPFEILTLALSLNLS